jgi:predicted NAD-dependent protein-ADP-ribosyltransferase YbiA (DUF1768 family)
MFWSSAKQPWHRLSNFQEMPVRYGGRDYPSSEHAFQAQLDMRGPEMYMTNGPLVAYTAQSFRETGAFPGMDEDKLQRKADWWAQKANIGILAKLAIKRAKDKKMKKSMTIDECALVFLEILLDKFDRNPTLKDVLLNTRDTYLLEFERGAERVFRKSNGAKRTRWGGMVVDGKIMGDNQMGKWMMVVRKELQLLEWWVRNM